MTYMTTLSLDLQMARRIDPSATALGSRTLRGLVRGMIIESVERGLEPVDGVLTGAGVRVSGLSMPDAVGDRVGSLADRLHASRADVYRGLVAAALQAGVTVEVGEPSPEFAEFLRLAGKQPRVPQTAVYRALMQCFAHGYLGLVEASTGVGKTLAVLGAANRLLEDSPGQQVAIAVPTVQIMRQYLAQNPAGAHALRPILGMREWVDLDALTRMLSDPRHAQHHQAISEWIAAEGPAPANSLIPYRWLVSSLLAIAPDFPAENCRMDEADDDDDPAYAECLHQFDRDIPGQIILCTHAMLAISTRARMRLGYSALGKPTAKQSKAWATKSEEERDLASAARRRKASDLAAEGKLPHIDALIVDEAHLIEQTWSAALSSYLAVHMHVSNIAEGARIKLIPAVRAERARKAVDTIIRAARAVIDAGGELEEVDLSEASTVYVDALMEIAAAGKPRDADVRSPEKKRLLKRLRRDNRTLCYALEHASDRGTLTRLRFSPQLQYPQVLHGDRSVSHYLRCLWAGLNSAACVSATLYVPSPAGASSKYMGHILALPRPGIDTRRLAPREFPPIVPQWIYQPRVRLNGVDFEAPQLRPPSRADRLKPKERKAKEREWLEALSNYLWDTIASRAPGGTLCLMTSYAACAALYEMASERQRARLVVAVPEGPRLARDAQKFLELARNGARPVWLAVGAAWTGLDVGGHEPYAALFGQALPATADHVLTDLVIPRLPFSANRTLSHTARMQSAESYPWERWETLFRLRQGIGRLIRREGLPRDRSVWLLDYRIAAPGFASIRSDVVRLLEPYEHGSDHDSEGDQP